MKFVVTEDKRYLRLVDATELEYEQLTISLTKKIKGHFFHPLVKKKLWDGSVQFFKNRMVPIGLWRRLQKIGETHRMPVEIEGLERIVDLAHDEEQVKLWAEEFFSDHPKYKARDYQINAASLAIQYRLSQSKIATSAGKTLISFIVYGYLKSIGVVNRMLVIVPNTTLVMQLKDDWEEYNNDKMKMNIRMVYGGSKDNDPTADIVVGTFQSLCKKDIEFFKGFNVINVDESHQTGVKSIKDTLEKCKDAHIRFGMSGTLSEEENADVFTIEALTGPIVNNIKPTDLFSGGHATPVRFKIIHLNYENMEFREALYDTRKSAKINGMEGSEILALEKKFVRGNKNRVATILKFVASTSKNTLVLFSDIKDGYGKVLYERTKDNTEKDCFYIDGGTKQDHREYYKKQMEEGNNKVLFASFSTFSTGVSIKNIHNIFFTESYKSEIIVKQSIGRGMRQIAGKDIFNVIDFIDDLSFAGKDNYLLDHGKSRLEFYKQYTDDIKIHKVSV